jgi:cell division transport system permease protein
MTPRHKLPLGRDEGLAYLPWVFGIFVYVAGLAGLGLLMVEDTLRAAEGSLAARLTVQVPAETSNARLQTLLAALRQASGVRSAQLLSLAETALLLEPWLGSPVPIEELPVPRLIDVAVDPGERIDLAQLRQHLATVIPEARLDDQRAALGGLRAAMLPLRAVLAAMIAAAVLLTAVLAVFATRTALVIGRTVIELLHLLGATDHDIALPLALRAARQGLLGGAIGSAAMVPTIAVLGGGGVIALPAPIAAIGVADWRLWAILIGIALAALLIATASALATVRRRLARLT